MEKKKSKVYEFLKPTKRKIRIFLVLIVIIFILNFFSLFLGRFSCFPAPCSEGNWSDLPKYYRPYFDCGRCIEPTLIKDIIGYIKYYSTKPLHLLFEIIEGKIIYLPFFILEVIILYLVACIYVEVKKSKKEK